MARRTASARWEGTLREGGGSMRLGSGAYEGAYSYKSRWEEGDGTNPEELIGAAHAGCFSMALSNGLSEAGHTVQSVETNARVHLEGASITRIELDAKARVPGIDQDELDRQAQTAKEGCPVSKALAGVEIEAQAELVG